MKKVLKTTGKIGIKCIILLMVMFCGKGFGQKGEYFLKKGIYSGIRSILTKDSLFISYPIRLDKNFKIKDSFKFEFQFSHVIEETKDKGFIVSYETNELLSTSSTNGSYRLKVIKLDSIGNIIWEKKYGNDSGSEKPKKIIEKPNGDILILSRSNSTNTGNKTSILYGGTDFWIIKLNKIGNKISEYSFGGLNADDPANFIIKPNGNMAFIGHTLSSNSGNKSSNLNGVWLFETDSIGNKFKDTTYPFSFQNNTIENSIASIENGFLIYGHKIVNDSNNLIKFDTSLNFLWNWNVNIQKNHDIVFDKKSNGNIFILTRGQATNGLEIKFYKISNNGNVLWTQSLKTTNISSTIRYVSDVNYLDNIFFITTNYEFEYDLNMLNPPASRLLKLYESKHKIQGSNFPDFNSNCTFNKSSEYNIKNFLIHNKVENTYATTNDSTYTMYLFDRDTAILKVINLDSNLYIACGKDSIVVDMTGKSDTSGIDFPIRSTKTGSCVKITSFSHSIMRPGLWGTYQLNYQNNAFDTAFNAYIDVEIDTAKIDSITSPYTFTKIGNILRFQIGKVRPFGTSSITYSVKLKTTVIIGSSICHRASVYPRCNLFAHPTQDSSVIELSMICRPNDTIEVQLKNIGTKNQSNWGLVKSYEDIIILYQDTFKLNVGNSRIFKYKLDTNKVYTAEVFNNNGDPINPILIRHDDQCANKKPIIFNNPALQFNRHDEAREYEEDCDIVRGSYDPNMKSVIPVGLFSEHYTSTGTELKYRIDFQNTGTDTAYRVVLVDTLSTDLNIASFVPGVSSHPYSIEFGGRAVKFIFDPIKLVDSFHNEPTSHGFVCFKINHVSGISPKTKIENKADIYFDYNTAVRTNTVFNTIFDTIQIYVPKGGGGTGSILGQNQMITDIYPNPASEKVFISMSESVKELKIEMIDMSGRLVQKQISKNDKSVELNVSNLQKGIYILRCMSGDKLVVVKKVEIK